MTSLNEPTFVEHILNAIGTFGINSEINILDVKIALHCDGADTSEIRNSEIGRLMRLRCDPVGTCYCGHVYTRRW